MQPSARPRPLILLVDDDPNVLAMLATLVRRADFDPINASDGMYALGILLAGHRPAAIVTDVQMPHIDGLTLVRRVRELEGMADIPVIVHSGEPQPEDTDGIDRWLDKGRAGAVVETLKELVG